jgi:ADP-dependent NAD(P)H-hydrate dehydratase / NAD(P)H-hydrate epimerase
MLPILTASQIREADAHTIANEPIASIELMERAAKVCCDWIIHHFSEHTFFTIVCGQGNNGGDGLAIARILHNTNLQCQVIVIQQKETGSTDFEINLERLQNTDVPITFITNTIPLDIFSSDGVIIDAIFGTGLTSPATGIFAQIIERMNTSERFIVSIDLPSGLFSEGSNKHINEGNTVLAWHTISFQVPKLSMLLPDSGRFAGHFTIADIGLDSQFIASCKTKNHILSTNTFAVEYAFRDKYDHKGSFGHALIIAGSRGKTGAAVLAAKACLRSGAGLVTVHCPSDSLNIVQTAVPEVMVSPDKGNNCIIELPELDNYYAIGVGPGLGTSKETAVMLKQLIQSVKFPLILDADALNILSENKTWISFLPKGSILTPHVGEFDRLFGKSESANDRLELQRSESVKHGIIIILKGAHTSVSFPNGHIYFNCTGNPGMATAGSGDVLTGIITGLFARTGSTAYAALNGVILHGTAGDMAAKKEGQESMIAGDIIRYLGKAHKGLIC